MTVTLTWYTSEATVTCKNPIVRLPAPGVSLIVSHERQRNECISAVNQSDSLTFSSWRPVIACQDTKTIRKDEKLIAHRERVEVFSPRRERERERERECIMFEFMLNSFEFNYCFVNMFGIPLGPGSPLAPFMEYVRDSGKNDVPYG